MATEPVIDRAALDHLIAKGRHQGRLTTDDLKAALPVGRLSSEDLALLIAEIEEAGVPVELSDDLLALSAAGVQPARVPPPPQVIDLPPTTTVPPPARPADAAVAPGVPPTPERAHRQVEAAAAGGWSPWTVILAGVIVVGAIFLLLYAFV